jgi:hypothetical protein
MIDNAYAFLEKVLRHPPTTFVWRLFVLGGFFAVLAFVFISVRAAPIILDHQIAENAAVVWVNNAVTKHDQEISEGIRARAALEKGQAAIMETLDKLQETREEEAKSLERLAQAVIDIKEDVRDLKNRPDGISAPPALNK